MPVFGYEGRTPGTACNGPGDNGKSGVAIGIVVGVAADKCAKGSGEGVFCLRIAGALDRRDQLGSGVFDAVGVLLVPSAPLRKVAPTGERYHRRA